MKPVAIAVASLFTVIGPAAHAAYDRYGNYYEPRDYVSSDFRGGARVIDSQPVYAAGGTREECVNTRRGQRCRTFEREHLLGYDVRYVYNGREYTARMNSDPGRRLVPGRDIRDDGTPYGNAPYAAGETLRCDAPSAADRPSWCDQDGQGG